MAQYSSALWANRRKPSSGNKMNNRYNDLRRQSFTLSSRFPDIFSTGASAVPSQRSVITSQHNASLRSTPRVGSSVEYGRRFEDPPTKKINVPSQQSSNEDILSLLQYQLKLSQLPSMDRYFFSKDTYHPRQQYIHQAEEKKISLNEVAYQVSEEVKNDMIHNERIAAKHLTSSSTIHDIFPPTHDHHEEDHMDIIDDDDNNNQQYQQQQLIHARHQLISEDELQHVKEIFHRPVSHDIVIDKFNIDMTIAKIQCLEPGTWLNDEVINFYMCMLQERDTKLRLEEKKKYGHNKIHTSHFFNSFFLDRLVDHGIYKYKNIKRWTKKFNIFEKEKIFFPINLHNTHWTLAVAFIQKKEIHYYDSMNGTRRIYLDAILQWLIDDANDKLKIQYDTSDWKIYDQEDYVPQQKNGFDCGLFTIMAADAIADDLPLNKCYSQADMAMNRYKVAAAILRGYINY